MLTKLVAALRTLLLIGLAFFIVAGPFFWGAFKPFDSALLDLLYRLFQSHATGDLVVVTIDPKSIEAIDSWPWQRTVHAEVLNRLVAAGAKQVAFDIDFSSRSTTENDAVLGAAIHDADGRVVLPVFKQHRLGAGESGELAYSAPIAPFQRDAKMGVVTIQPDTDGRIWHSRTADEWRGWTIPTIAGLLSGHGRDKEQIFLIDYGVRTATVPTLSYIDVLRGDFDPSIVAGRNVLIGASAVELGDRHATPLHADLPGVMIQALAFESLVQHHAAREAPQAWVLMIAGAIAIPLGFWFARVSWRRGIAATIIVGATILAASMIINRTTGLYIAAATPIIGTFVAYLVAVLHTIDLQTLRIFNDQIEAAQRRALMKSVVESSFDGIVIAEQDGKVTMINPMASTMLSIAAGEALGRDIRTIMTGIAGVYEDPLGIGAVPLCETVLHPAEGDAVAVEITVATAAIEPMRHPLERRRETRQVFIYTLHDVTERRRAEEAQRLASEAAMAASRAKTEFLATMSHELRTPLNAVIGFSEIIKEEMLGPVGQTKYRDYAKDIHGSGTHLLEVINDILSVSRIELGEMKLNEAEIDLTHIVNSTLRLIGPHANEKSIEIDMQIPAELATLYGDERSVRQMLQNILSNAVKFTAENGRIAVSAMEDAQGGIVVAVRDTGIGIDAENIARVTQPFFQVDGRLDRRFEGTGLGLSIVKGMMELHGGTIDIESALGEGTTVTLRFPASRAVPQMAAA